MDFETLWGWLPTIPLLGPPLPNWLGVRWYGDVPSYSKPDIPKNWETLTPKKYVLSAKVSRQRKKRT